LKACPNEGLLSNRLPIALVEELSNLGFWNDHFDRDTPQSRSLTAFWESLGDTSSSVEDVVDQIFGSSAQMAFSDQLPELYPIKVHVLRYLNEQSQSVCISPSKVKNVYQAWKLRYINDFAIPLIQSAQISKLDSVIREFQRKLIEGELELIDLSPKKRNQLVSQTPERHRDSLTKINPETGKYGVSGFYSSRDKIFAVDFARPIGETLITFTHEMIHAGDLELDDLKREWSKIYPKVLSVLTQWLGKSDQQLEIAKSLVNRVLFLVEPNSYSKAFMRLTQQKLEALQEQIRKQTSLEEKPLRPSESELDLIDRFFNIATHLTLGNEYKAYGYSAILYHKLNQSWILPPSDFHSSELDKVTMGDQYFATSIFLEKSLSPFPTMRRSLGTNCKALTEELTGKPSPTEASEDSPTIEQHRQEIQFELRLCKVLNHLEYSYLKELKSYINDLKDQFSGTIKWISENTKDTQYDSLPYYARPGSIDESLNPYSVLAARLTTAWVIRFKNNLLRVDNYVRSLNTSLIGLEFGVLDLHDLNESELQLVGLSYENTTPKYGVFPEETRFKSQRPNESGSIDYKNYFELVKWNKSSLNTFDPVVTEATLLPSDDLMTQLIRLHMIKSYKWLDDAFPIYHQTLVGSVNFLNKLHMGNFNKNEISEDRAEALSDEILGMLRLSGSTKHELVVLDRLFNSLGMAYGIARDQRWSEIEKSFREGIHSYISSMNLLRIYSGQDIKPWNEQRENFQWQLSSSLKEAKERCHLKKSGIGSVEQWQEEQVSIGEQSFPSTVICNNNQLYLIRQPEDKTESLTIRFSYRNGASSIYTSLGSNGRPFTLKPFQAPDYLSSPEKR
tara:strand:+ start:55777 stop:58314 length:2538 start_codon:yes stop_codon:yes gene_type:complete